MVATSITKVVNVKEDKEYLLYESANINSKHIKQKLSKGTNLKVTKSSGKFYYLSEYKKWILKDLVTENEKATKAEVWTNSVKAKFKNPDITVATFKTSKSTAVYGSHVPGKKTYTITRIENGRALIKQWDEWVRLSLLNTDTITGKTENTPKEKVIGVIEGITASQAELLKGLQAWEDYGNEAGKMSDQDLSIKTPIGIYGIPYQFSESVDRKLEGTTFGQYYADRVISRMPLLVLSPGKVNFMAASNKDDSNTIIKALINTVNGADNDLSSYLTKPGKYYTFEYDPLDYWEYVNTMNQACATYLGIKDIKVKINNYESRLSSFKWENAVNQEFGTWWLQSSSSFVTFYADSESTTGEDFSNTTTQSMIAGTLNKSSEIGREIRFLLGEHGTLTDIIDTDTIQSALSQITNLTSGMLGENNIVTQMSKEFAVIATGGKLIFPELWDDSSYTKDFDCKIKLRCPCPNKLAWFLDICVPLNHLLAFTMPRTPHGNDIAGQLLSSDLTANGYFSPFLVRGFYKGISSVDMGIVTGLRIDKGKEGSWTIDNLPTEVDVSLTIKDLYTAMAMTPYKQHSELLSNTQYLSYLAFNCGIAINQPDVMRSITLYGSIFNLDIYKNITIDKLTGYRFWGQAAQNIRNKYTSFYSGWAL